MKKNDV
jgi:hypothetical protein